MGVWLTYGVSGPLPASSSCKFFHCTSALQTAPLYLRLRACRRPHHPPQPQAAWPWLFKTGKQSLPNLWKCSIFCPVTDTRGWAVAILSGSWFTKYRWVSGESSREKGYGRSLRGALAHGSSWDPALPAKKRWGMRQKHPGPLPPTWETRMHSGVPG